jgi:cell division protein FtsA
MFNDYVAIVDIGTTKVVAMVGRKDPAGNLQILGYGEEKSAGISRGLVVNLNHATETIKKAVDKAKEQSGIKFQEVYVGIAGQHIFSQLKSHSIINENGDIITKKLLKKLSDEIYNMALSPGEQILHVFPQSYRVDNTEVEDPVGAMGKQLVGQFSISIGKEKSIQVIKRSVEQLGLKVVKIILEPVASAEAVLTEEEKEAGVILVDIGGGTSDMVIFKDKILRHSAVIPLGGKSITSDLQKGCNILERYAEDIKVKYGSAIADMVDATNVATVPSVSGRPAREISFKTIAEIIQARIIEIIDTVRQEIKNSGLHSGLAGGLTLTGGGALLKDLPMLFEYRTGLETKISKPEKYIYVEQDSFKNPKYSTAIGLLLKGLEYEKQRKEMYIPPPPVVEEEILPEDNGQTPNNPPPQKPQRNIWRTIFEKLTGALIEDDEGSEIK